jgi:hypothetical protein
VPGAAASDRGWHRAAPALAGLAIAAAGCARSAAALERREPTFTRVTPVAASEVEAALLADAPGPVETVRLVALLTRTVDHLDAALASVCGSIGAAGSETPGFLDGVRAARDHRAAAHEQAYRAALLLSAAATAANGLADEVEGWTIDGRSDGRGWVDQLGTYVPGMLIAAGLWDRIDDVRGLDAGDGTFCHLGPRLRAAAGTSTTFSVELEAWPQTDPPVRSRYTRESLPAG